MRSKRTGYIIFILLTICFFSSYSQTKYGLLIGINNYIKPDSLAGYHSLSRKNIPDLRACINDVLAIREMLTIRFDFDTAHITTLFDQNATRAGILNALDELKDKCKKGDYAFIYYSGHGSQVKNLFSHEPDGMDETIVPADGIYPGRDIRDKELAFIFQSFLAKGVVLTSVFDACHSGSIARGLEIEYKMVSPTTDVIRDSIIYPKPENEGALILSAAQDYQMAAAGKYENIFFRSHFTKALIDVLNKNKSDISAEELKSAVESRMKYMGFSQVPVLAANSERRKQNLIGLKLFQDKGTVAVVRKVLPDKKILLDGGFVTGIEPGAVLTDLNENIKIEIVENIGLNQSVAKPISLREGHIRAGTFFKMKKKSALPESRLQLAMATYDSNFREFQKILAGISLVLHEKSLNVITDATQMPDYLLFFNNKKWHLHSKESDIVLNDQLLDLSSFLEKGKSIRLQLPLYKELYLTMHGMIADQYSCVKETDFNSSDYYISGTLIHNKLGYAVMKTNSNNSGDSEYPLRSDIFSIHDSDLKSISSNMCSSLWKLARMKSWLTLENNTSDDNFPYRLFLKNKTTGHTVQDCMVKEGEVYKFYLKKSDLSGDSVKRRYVYIFCLAADGSIQLLFPEGKDNIENFLPVHTDKTEEEIFANEIAVTPPFGMDHILMLTTQEPLANPSVIEQEGISTRDVSNNPIANLIARNNSRTRAAKTVTVPDNWSLQKIRFKSIPK